MPVISTLLMAVCSSFALGRFMQKFGGAFSLRWHEQIRFQLNFQLRAGLVVGSTEAHSRVNHKSWNVA